MPELLQELHQGHAPITLLHAFQDATDALDGDAAEPMAFVDGRAVSVAAIFEALLGCTDLMPFHARESVNAVLAMAGRGERVESGAPYARGAMLMLSHCRRGASPVPPAACHGAVAAPSN